MCIVQLPGRILPHEKIFLGGNREVDSGLEADWGRDVTRSHVISAVSLHICYFVQSAGLILAGFMFVVAYAVV